MKKKLLPQEKRGNLRTRDLKMFDLLCRYHDVDLVADKLGIEASSVYSRIDWIREKEKDWQWNINTLNNAKKKCNRLKKLLETGELKK